MRVAACLYCDYPELVTVTERADGVGIIRCTRCSLMMVDTLSEDTGSMYSKEYFQKTEATKQGYTDYLSAPAANLIGKYAFARLLRRTDGGRHLDLGCADGSLMEIFAGDGFETRGLEISAEAVAIARGKGLDVRQSQLHTFPDDMPASDLITAYDLLEHADRPGAVLRGAHQNLAEGGSFVFSTLSVKKLNTSEYWFNTSLEHYVYFDRDSLTFLLTDVFGKGNFAFVEAGAGDAKEFWGFAKKGVVAEEPAVLSLIGDRGSDPDDPEAGYLLSLFYDQLSEFAASQRIIRHFEAHWPARRTVQAKFYRNFLQGKFEQALKVADASQEYMPVSDVVYWQALAYVQAEYGKAYRQAFAKGHETEIEALHAVARETAEAHEAELQALRDTYNAEILGLRSDLFKVRDELHSLTHSRVLGRIIKVRSVVGDSARQAVPVVKGAPAKGLYKTRKAVAKVLPPPLSRAIMRQLRSVKRQLAARNTRPVRYEVVANEAWPADAPLLSVIIPYYNRADTIDDTLDSLAGQTFRDFEVIIVDDGSTDAASVAKLKDLKHDVPRLQVIHQENQGVAAARNDGIGLSRGKYVICLDSDDMLDATFIEKAVVVLESDPEVSLITSHQDMFGVMHELYTKSPYDPMHLYQDNMVITAAAFRKEAWKVSGGYKSGIGYEDWEFWLNLAEHGFWGRLIPEPLFRYRVALQSRYVDDKDVHWNNIKAIRSLHPRYRQTVKALLQSRSGVRKVAEIPTSLQNLARPDSYLPNTGGRPNVLIAVPWMTFGGAETLIYNFCREIKADFDISFVTGLDSDHEWEYKFREISPRIYHLANLFEDERLFLEFVSQYIATRRIAMLHIIHNGFVYGMLPELKRRHPELRVIVTVFNDRAPWCEQSIAYEDQVDVYSADNKVVTDKYESRLKPGKAIVRIPNGINAYEEFNQAVCDRQKERSGLGIGADDIAVFFVGRLSEEKNPDVFLRAARRVVKTDKSKRIRFFMIGDGPMKPQIEHQLKDIQSDRVTYLGYQSEVARFLSAADAFVLPSSIEGFPLSILEAMAMEVVPVASRVGGVPDIITDGQDGFVVEPGSDKEIAAAIVALRDDPVRFAAMKAAARKKIESTYSNRILGDNYRALYRRALK